jgi:hypothetical protein
MHTLTTPTPEVTGFIANLIERSGKTRKEIAYSAGFGKPNIISMIKSGETKLPLAKIGAFAKAVNTDPVALLKMCIRDYYPEVWQALMAYWDESLTSEELKMVRAMRSAVGVPYLSALKEEERQRLEDFLCLLAQSKTVH